MSALLFVLLTSTGFFALIEGVRAQNIGDTTIQAVVRIRGCDISGCNRGLGSGVVIHPNGLILTARHVTQNNPFDPNSGFLDDFVIEVTDNARVVPTARYRANLAATSNAETDLALLWIYWDEVAGLPISPGTLSDLPFLTMGDSTTLDLGETLHILGYPLAGGEAINLAEEGLSGFLEYGAMLKVSASLSEGNSGGPVLIERDGVFQIVGTVIRRQGTLGEVGIIRSINELRNLDWTPSALQVWSSPTQIESDGDQLQLRTTFNAIDFDQRAVRLLAYAFDATNPHRPWPSTNLALASRSGQLVIAHEVTVDGTLVINQPVQFSLPQLDIDAETNQLVFQTVLWSPDARSVLWSENRPILITNLADTVQADVFVPEQQPFTNTLTATTTEIPSTRIILTPTASTLQGHTPISVSSTNTLTIEPTLALPAVYDPVLAANITNLVDLAPYEVMRLGRGRINEIAYSPDGSQAAVATSIGIWLYQLNQLDNGRFLSGHTSGVNSIMWSPDGLTIISHGDDGSLKLWNAKKGEELYTLANYTNRDCLVTWSPNGRTILADGRCIPGLNHSFRLWNANTGNEIPILPRHTNTINMVVWSPDSQTIVSASSDNTLKLWDANNGREIRTFFGHTGAVASVAWSPDGQTIVSASTDKTLKLWNVNTGKDIYTLAEHKEAVSSVLWSPDGQTILSGSYDDTLRFWNPNTGTRINIIFSHSDGVTSVAWSPNGETILSHGGDGTIKLWNASNDKELSTFRKLSGNWSVVWSPNGQAILSDGYNGILKLWNALTGEELLTFTAHTGDINAVAWSPNGQTILSGSRDDDTLGLWDVNTSRQIRTMFGHLSGVWQVAWSPDSKTIVSNSTFNKPIKLWNANTGEELRALTGHAQRINRVAWSPDGQRVVSGSIDNSLKLWDANTGKELRTFFGHSGYVNAVAWSPDGQTIVSGSDDNTLKLWNVSTGEILHTLTGHTTSVGSVGWNPDGQTIVSSGVDDFHLWNANTGQKIHTFFKESLGIRQVTWSPDGQTIVLGSEDKTLKIWNAKTGGDLRSLTGHTDWVTSVAWSPDGGAIVSGSRDNTLKFWNANTGEELFTLIGHTDTVWSVGWSYNGEYVVSGSEDGTIRVWDVRALGL